MNTSEGKFSSELKEFGEKGNACLNLKYLYMDEWKVFAGKNVKLPIWRFEEDEYD
jgi:hypothetical protein